MALIMLWCALGALVLFLVLAAPLLPFPADLYTRLALVVAIPVFGVIGIVFASIGLHRAGRLDGYRKGTALGALIGNVLVTVLGIPIGMAISNIIYAFY